MGTFGEKRNDKCEMTNDKTATLPFVISSFVICHSSVSLVSRVGIEPTTNWLKANCSTTELPARRIVFKESRDGWPGAGMNDTDEQPIVSTSGAQNERGQGFIAARPYSPPCRLHGGVMPFILA
jgi:hypothetical protein